MENLNQESKRNLTSVLEKNVIWNLLSYKTESDMRAKSVNRAPFKATDCQNATKMWFSLENLRK